MTFLYQIFVNLFNFFLHVASLFNKKARLFVQGRKNLFEDLKTQTSQLLTPDTRLIWFHCASLGEFEQVRPLIEELRIKNEKLKILITFFSPSGYEIRKNYAGANFVFYMPVDTRSNVRKFLDIVNPSQVFFVKYDYWYNYLNELQLRKIPTYLVSANFRKEQFKGLYGKYLGKVLGFFTHIFVQNDSSIEILSKQKIQNVTVSGDLRYDKVSQSALKPKKVALVEFFVTPPAPLLKEKGESARSKILVCGSTWISDEEIISSWQPGMGNWKLIIAPHEISEEHISKIISLFPDSLRFSVINKEPATTALDKLQSAKVLIIDNIGMLSNLYQYANIAYVGGGFGTGIHNILEAVAFGVPVIFGSNHHKFPEAGELIEKGGGFSISNSSDFSRAMELFLSDDKIIKMASMTCKNFVAQKKGATEKILSKIEFTRN